MDETCLKIVGGMSVALGALVVVIRILWVKIGDERREAERVKEEILDLHKRRIAELEAFKRMIEEKGRGL